ncbi:MAG: molybdate ABC transporter substrate-binding protein [Usitatibacter sp.]
MRLDFVSAGAAHALVSRIASQDGIEVAGSFGAVGAMLEKFEAGEPCDVVILTKAQIARLAERGAVIASTVGDLGAAPTAIAVRAGEALPDVSNEAALRAALLAADAVYFPDPAKATAGIHFAKVIDQLGIRDSVSSRLRTFPNGATAMKAMGEASGHPIGCTQATEILAVPTVRLVAALPKGFDLATVYTAAAGARTSRREAAEAFVAKLTGAASAAARHAAGFE